MSDVYSGLIYVIEVTEARLPGLKETYNNLRTTTLGQLPANFKDTSPVLHGEPQHWFDSINDQIDHQHRIVVNCLQQMEAASKLIELQNYYYPHANEGFKAQIRETASNDTERFHDGLDAANEFHQSLKGAAAIQFDEESYRLELDRLVEIVGDEPRRREVPRWSYKTMNAQKLLETIFYERLEAAKLSVTATDLNIDTINEVAKKLADLRARQREGSLSSEALPEREAYRRQAYCERGIEIAERNISRIYDFAARLKVSDIERTNPRIIPLRSYLALSIDQLPQISP